MNKVITINLNGRAFLLEEGGYEKLQAYLQDSRSRLGKDPDKEEIVKDLEQAVAEKFSRFLTAGKTVVLETEVDEVIKEMGPVQGDQTANDGTTASSENQKETGSPKRLYLVSEGAMFRGVCAGLAAYFNADVTLIRVIFVVLTILSHGLGIVVYLIMMIVVPKANTSKEKARAYGQPFTAQELVDRAKQEYHNFANKSEWKKWRADFRQHRREERQRWRQQRHESRCHGHLPFFGLLTTALSVLWILGLISLVAKGAILGYAIPAGIPLWVALLAWLSLYSFVVWPFKAARRHRHLQNDQAHHCYRGGGFPEFIATLIFWSIIIWILWHFYPASHPYFYKVSLWGQHVWDKIKR
jgi:phage shock protein PspC (stress-responsive transcriptional regulator)